MNVASCTVFICYNYQLLCTSFINQSQRLVNYVGPRGFVKDQTQFAATGEYVSVNLVSNEATRDDGADSSLAGLLTFRLLEKNVRAVFRVTVICTLNKSVLKENVDVKTGLEK